MPVVLVVTVPWTLALVVGRGYLAAAVFAVGHFLLLGYVDGKFEASSKMHLLGLPSALITLSIALGFDRIGTAGLVLGPLVLAVAAIGFDAATAADEDSDDDDDDEADVQPPRPARAVFDAASSVTDSDKSLRGNSCDASQPNCRLCPPDLPPRDGPTATTTENAEKAPPPLPPRGAVAKSPSRASPYAGLGK